MPFSGEQALSFDFNIYRSDYDKDYVQFADAIVTTMGISHNLLIASRTTTPSGAWLPSTPLAPMPSSWPISA